MIDPGVDVFDDPVEDGQVDALGHSHVVELDVEAILGGRFEFAAVVGGDGECVEASAVGPLDGCQDVGAVAGTADGDGQIARLGVLHQLLEEDRIETHVVTQGGYPTGIVAETHHSGTFLGVVVEVAFAQRILAEVFGEMRGGCPRAAVSEDEDEMAGLMGLVYTIGQSPRLGLVQPIEFALQPLEILVDVVDDA